MMCSHDRALVLFAESWGPIRWPPLRICDGVTTQPQALSVYVPLAPRYAGPIALAMAGLSQELVPRLQWLGATPLPIGPAGGGGLKRHPPTLPQLQ